MGLKSWTTTPGSLFIIFLSLFFEMIGVSCSLGCSWPFCSAKFSLKFLIFLPLPHKLYEWGEAHTTTPSLKLTFKGLSTVRKAMCWMIRWGKKKKQLEVISSFSIRREVKVHLITYLRVFCPNQYLCIENTPRSSNSTVPLMLLCGCLKSITSWFLRFPLVCSCNWKTTSSLKSFNKGAG